MKELQPFMYIVLTVPHKARRRQLSELCGGLRGFRKRLRNSRKMEAGTRPWLPEKSNYSAPRSPVPPLALFGNRILFIN